MDLPRELRDQIWTHVLLTPATPPDLSQSFHALLEGRVKTSARFRKSLGGVFYSAQPSAHPSVPLLLLNKQLHQETLSTLHHLEQRPSCHMDLIIADEMALLPTWTRLPFSRTTALDTVDVSFRIAGAYERKKNYEGLPRGFSGGDGGGPWMSFYLHHLLERFVYTGPGREDEVTDANRHVTAKCLRIDVQTPAGIDPSRFGTAQTGFGPWKIGRRPEADVLGPEWLATFTGRYVSNLLRLTVGGWDKYGNLLFEHLDEVVVCLDGVERERWDVAECLRLRDTSEYDGQSERLVEGKKAIWKARRERGLKVFDD